MVNFYGLFNPRIYKDYKVRYLGPLPSPRSSRTPWTPQRPRRAVNGQDDVRRSVADGRPLWGETTVHWLSQWTPQQKRATVLISKGRRRTASHAPGYLGYVPVTYRVKDVQPPGHRPSFRINTLSLYFITFWNKLIYAYLIIIYIYILLFLYLQFFFNFGKY